MQHEREVAGMRCGEVLAELSDYLDGDMVVERRTQVLAHLQGCETCARFGGVFSAAIQALRQGHQGHPSDEPMVFQRLRDRLKETVGRDMP